MKKAVLILAIAFANGGSFASARVDVQDICGKLMEADFSRTLDAPTKVVRASSIAAHDGLPSHCQVDGYVTPNVGFGLFLPRMDSWNGKFLEHGCGGFCGEDIVEQVQRSPGYLSPLRRGYAVLLFDGGNKGGGASGLWAYNNFQAQFDFGIRAPHVAALAGKAIVERHYGSPPSRSYFFGCSSGGQQGLSEAQRFPWDFDGIVVGAPSLTFSGPMMYYLWAARALAGVVSQHDLELVNTRAVAHCDMDDGVKDGIIGDPLRCGFDPRTLLCTGARRDGCLTLPQVEAVRKVYSGPLTSKGERIYTGGPLPGSELNWIPGYLVDGKMAPWPKEYFAYIGFMPSPGPTWTPSEFDFDRDYKRLRLAESLFGAADNPDLRKFKAAGGKLIMYQGGSDESDVPSDAIDYYETVEKTMGGAFEHPKFLPPLSRPRDEPLHWWCWRRRDRLSPLFGAMGRAWKRARPTDRRSHHDPGALSSCFPISAIQAGQFHSACLSVPSSSKVHRHWKSQ